MAGSALLMSQVVSLQHDRCHSMSNPQPTCGLLCLDGCLDHRLLLGFGSLVHGEATGDGACPTGGRALPCEAAQQSDTVESHECSGGGQRRRCRRTELNVGRFKGCHGIRHPTYCFAKFKKQSPEYSDDKALDYVFVVGRIMVIAVIITRDS